MSADFNLGPSLLTACWILAAVAICVVTLRVITRAKTTDHLGADDYMMILSLLLDLTCTALVTVAVKWGLGRHLIYLDPEQRFQALKFDFIEQPFIVMGPCFGRISFALFLIQILRKNVRRRRFLYFIIICQLIINGATAVIILAQCRPFSALWDPNVKGNCWSPHVQEYFSYFQGSWNACTDLTLALFPATFLWDLNLPLRKRIGLMLIMGLGIFAMVATIIKTIQLKSLAATSDYTYATAVLILWTSIELYFVNIAASIPVIVPAYRWATVKLRSYKEKTLGSWTRFGSDRRGLASETGQASSRFAPGSYTKVEGRNNSEEQYPLPSYPTTGIVKSTNVIVHHESQV